MGSNSMVWFRWERMASRVARYRIGLDWNRRVLETGESKEDVMVWAGWWSGYGVAAGRRMRVFCGDVAMKVVGKVGG